MFAKINSLKQNSYGRVRQVVKNLHGDKTIWNSPYNFNYWMEAYLGDISMKIFVIKLFFSPKET